MPHILLSDAAHETESPDFTAEKGTYYDIEIAPGGNLVDLKQIDISYAILEGGRSVVSGNSKQILGHDGDDIIIGYFRPEHDGRYKLSLNVRGLAVKPAASFPELIVIPDIGRRDDIGMGAGILEFSALGCALVGLMALAVAAGMFAKRQAVPAKWGEAKHS